jgi:hypothetical protein
MLFKQSYFLEIKVHPAFLFKVIAFLINVALFSVNYLHYFLLIILLVI